MKNSKEGKDEFIVVIKRAVTTVAATMARRIGWNMKMHMTHIMSLLMKIPLEGRFTKTVMRSYIFMMISTD